MAMFILIIFLAVSLISSIVLFVKLMEMSKNHAIEQSNCEKIKYESQRKSEFLANLSHELRTPLNGIIVGSQVLQEPNPEEKAKELASIINSSGKLILNLVSEILDFSKIEAGKLELDYKTVKIKSILQEIELSFRESFKTKLINLEFIIDESIPEKIYTDDLRLKQILFNLIGNAYKFTEKGGVKVHITSNDDFLYFEIKDTGVGIHKDRLHLVFDPYVQENEKTQTKYGGTGLGLTICKSLVELLGGTITVDSILGEGTTMLFCIKKETVLESLTQKSVTKDETIHDFSVLNILVVDDNAVNRKVLDLTLRKFDCRVAFAVNGQEAIDMALAEKFDLILMDIQMPIKNGIEACEEIIAKSNLQDLPLIFGLSADVFKKTKDDCFNVGMSGFLDKPLNIKTLHGPLVMALGRQKKTDKAC